MYEPFKFHTESLEKTLYDETGNDKHSPKHIKRKHRLEIELLTFLNPCNVFKCICSI